MPNHQLNAIYILGGPHSGKSEVISKVIEHFVRVVPFHPVDVVRDVLKDLTQEIGIASEDIRKWINQDRLFAKQFLARQAEAEHRSEGTLCIADSAGIDPLVYSLLYGDIEDTEELTALADWVYLLERMAHALVFICEPSGEWSKIKNLIMGSKKDSFYMHEAYCQMLTECRIAYHVLPASLNTQQRIEKIISMR